MIETTVSSVVYTADGSQTQWTIPFSYGNIDDVKLLVKIGTADIAPVASNLFEIDTDTNKLTYPKTGDPVSSGDKVIIVRATDQTQEESSVLLSFKSEDIERMADKLTMEVQELQNQLSRCIMYNLVDAAEGEVDAQKYIDDLTDLKDTATTQAGIATSAATTATDQAGLASAAKTAAETAQDKAEKWAEGTDAQVAALGGTHSAEGWAGIAQTAAESENVQTVIANMSDINSVADNITDVTTVSNISSAVSNVADNDTEVLLVSDNMASVITTASNISNVNTVAGVSTKVSTVADNISDVGTVADNISDVGTVANVSTAISTVANDINAVKAVNNNKTNIDAVATNQSNINAVASNATNINAVNANKTNIDAVADNETNINTVATNISDVSSVAADVTNINAVAADLTNIDAVNTNATNINTVATNISDVNATGQAIEDVSAVADNISDITLVANDLENIDEVATNVAQWQKPTDWVDIRSGAVAESFTILTGHTADYSAYDYVAFTPTLSDTSNTYSVFIDGLYYNSYTSGTTFELQWSTSGITSGWDVTYPEALRTHTIRFTPDNASDHFTAITGARPTGTATNVNYAYGTLWAHFTTVNEISVEYLFSRYASQYYNPNIEAVTAIGDTLVVSGIRGFLGKGLDVWNTGTSGSKRLSYLPKIDYNGHTINSTGAFNCSSQYVGTLKEIRLANGNASAAEGTAGALFANLKALKKITCDNWRMAGFGSRVFANCSALEKLPPFVTNYGNTSVNITDILLGCTGLKDTVINVTRANENQPINYFRCGGSSSNRLDGVKGVLFNQNMTSLTGASPQINVSYTGMDRQALVNMFKSMPYNVGYTVVGSPTITNGVVSGFSNSDFLIINNFVPNKPSWDIIHRAKIVGNWGHTIAFGNGQNLFVEFGKTALKLHAPSVNISIANSFVPDTYYYIRVRKLGTTIYLDYSIDGAAYLSTVSAETDYTSVDSVQFRFGYASYYSNSGFPGSIDLNETYIYVNGVPLFTGKAAMTKTCSIVGCTGTADLTAEDKAIATDKGWALTLS